MTDRNMTLEAVIAENENLRARLEEAESVIRAIRSGEIDAVVVTGPEGEQIYTLSGAEHTYRILVEAMNEGALVLSSKGDIIYCNHSFAAMPGAPIHQVLGHAIYEFVADADAESVRYILERAPLRAARSEINLKQSDNNSIPAFISVGNLENDVGPSISAVVTDLTEYKRTEAELEKYREHLEDLVVERTSELALANEKLAESERRVTSIFESINDAFIAIGRDWRFSYINAAAQRTIYGHLGRNREELIGKGIWEEFPELRETAIYENYSRAMFERVPVLFDVYYSPLDTWYGINVYPYENGICAYCQDITERKQAEEALKESTQRLREAQSIARFGRWDLDLINGQLQCSSGICELFEIDQEKFGASYEAFLELIHPDDREMVKQAYANSLKNRTPYENTYRLLMKDGRIKWMSEDCRTEYNFQDQAIWSVGIVQDITERKTIENTQMFLLQFGYTVPGEDFFQALANHIAATLGTEYVRIDRLEGDCLSAQNIVTYYNGRFEDGVAQTLKDKPYSDVAGETICSFPRDVRSLFPHDAVLQEMNAESYIGANLYNSKGQPIGLITIISRKPMGNLNLAESLLKLVSIRAASELERIQYEKEIVNAKEEADAANLSKSRFLANMSHEIRTPMGGIIGMINAILSTKLTDQQQEFLSIAKTASEILLRVVNDILDYSKIEAERVNLVKSSFKINMVIKEVVDLFNVSAKQKGLSIFVNINNDVPPNLTGDPVRLRQILSNLIGNAIKFTDRGSVTISVRKTKSHDKKVTLQFDIEDTGVGIHESNLDKLFNSFSQLDNSYTRQYGGTGLGLVISKKLIEIMDGRIWVSSKEGAGSTFSCTAVFESGEELQVSEVQAHDSIAGIPGNEANRYIILLAEDEEINRKVGIYYLQKAGYKVVVATNGKEAIDLFKKGEIDLILMDVQMPEMDGFSATMNIRHLENPESRNVPIIAMTAHTLKGDKEKCMEAGMDDYLSKPVKPNELFEKLDRWLRISKQ